MRIEAITVALPSRIVTNEEILDLVFRNSQSGFDGDLPRTLNRIRKLLQHSQAETRHWLGAGESPIGLIRRAFNDALARASVEKTAIDLVIYAGVDRGFLEPANAYLVAQALGLDNSECFDILDACNGWVRALRVAERHLAAGDYQMIAIINSEFNLFEGGTIYPHLFKLDHPDEIKWCFPAYTLGEGATITLVSAAENGTCEFLSRSRTEFADLCTVPVYAHERYCNPPTRIAMKGRGLFTSFGSELFAQATDEAISLFKRMKTPAEEIKAIFPHAASKTAWEAPCRDLGIADRLYHIYPHCGNMISASVPAGIALALEEGRISRGDRVVAWVASAGMSFSLSSFVY